MKIEEVLKIIDQVRQEHPYKVSGRQETYDPYNEGWEDACCKIEAIISGMQGEGEKKYACKYCGNDNLFLKQNGTQTGLYCGECGKRQKWVGKLNTQMFGM